MEQVRHRSRGLSLGEQFQRKSLPTKLSKASKEGTEDTKAGRHKARDASMWTAPSAHAGEFAEKFAKLSKQSKAAPRVKEPTRAAKVNADPLSSGTLSSETRWSIEDVASGGAGLSPGTAGRASSLAADGELLSGITTHSLHRDIERVSSQCALIIEVVTDILSGQVDLQRGFDARLTKRSSGSFSDDACAEKGSSALPGQTQLGVAMPQTLDPLPADPMTNLITGRSDDELNHRPKHTYPDAELDANPQTLPGELAPDLGRPGASVETVGALTLNVTADFGKLTSVDSWQSLASFGGSDLSTLSSLSSTDRSSQRSSTANRASMSISGTSRRPSTCNRAMSINGTKASVAFVGRMPNRFVGAGSTHVEGEELSPPLQEEFGMNIQSEFSSSMPDIADESDEGTSTESSEDEQELNTLDSFNGATCWLSRLQHPGVLTMASYMVNEQTEAAVATVEQRANMGSIESWSTNDGELAFIAYALALLGYVRWPSGNGYTAGFFRGSLVASVVALLVCAQQVGCRLLIFHSLEGEWDLADLRATPMGVKTGVHNMIALLGLLAQIYISRFFRRSYFDRLVSVARHSGWAHTWRSVTLRCLVLWSSLGLAAGVATGHDLLSESEQHHIDERNPLPWLGWLFHPFVVYPCAVVSSLYLAVIIFVEHTLLSAASLMQDGYVIWLMFAETRDQVFGRYNTLAAFTRTVSDVISYPLVIVFPLVPMCFFLALMVSLDSGNRFDGGLVYVFVGSLSILFHARNVTTSAERIPLIVQQINFGLEVDLERQCITNGMKNDLAAIRLFGGQEINTVVCAKGSWLCFMALFACFTELRTIIMRQ